MSSPNWSRRGFVLAAASTPFLLNACGESSSYQGPSVALKWNETALDAIRNGSLPPPMVSRALGMLYTAMYDAWAPYDAIAIATLPGGPARLRSLGSETTVMQEKAVSYAAYEVLKDVYPEQAAKFAATLNALGFAPDAQMDTNDPGQVGKDAAIRLLTYRWADGSNQKGNLAPGAYADYTGYTAVNTVDKLNDPSRWQPIKFSNGRAPGFVAPQWGRVTPFSLKSASEYRPNLTLPGYGTKAFKDQVDQVLQYTANLTDEQKVIAEYWANGPRSETPPGHWHKIGQWVSERDRHSLELDIKMFFLLGNAVMDSGIACWDCKVHFDSVRPITAVRSMYAGQQVVGLVSQEKGLGLMPGEQWSPYQLGTFLTPPFAEFVSGHSTFSAASAEILARFTGSDNYGGQANIAVGSMTQQAGIPRQQISLQWQSFTDAAAQAGLSRLYGGIHFEAGNTYGKELGRMIANRVWIKAAGLFGGVPQA